MEEADRYKESSDNSADNSVIIYYLVLDIIGLIISGGITFIYFLFNLFSLESLFVIELFVVLRTITSIASFLLTRRKYTEKSSIKKFQNFLPGYWFLRQAIIAFLLVIIFINKSGANLGKFGDLITAIKTVYYDCSSEFAWLFLILYIPIVSTFIYSKRVIFTDDEKGLFKTIIKEEEEK